MEERRVAINFSVPLGTPTETLKNIPKQVAAVVNKTPDLRFGRAHLSLYQESGLQFEVVFFVLSADYEVYMDAQQAVLIGLLEALRADGIDLAQPTTVMIPPAKPPARRLEPPPRVLRRSRALRPDPRRRHRRRGLASGLDRREAWERRKKGPGARVRDREISAGTAASRLERKRLRPLAQDGGVREEAARQVGQEGEHRPRRHDPTFEAEGEVRPRVQRFSRRSAICSPRARRSRTCAGRTTRSIPARHLFSWGWTSPRMERISPTKRVWTARRGRQAPSRTSW